MTDIVERLRQVQGDNEDTREAADTIERMLDALKAIECHSIDHTDACRMAGKARAAAIAQAMTRTWQSDPVDLQNRLCNQITQLRAEVERLRAHVLGAEREVERLTAALATIAAIKDQAFGDDYQEIEEARSIAKAALEPKP